MKIWIKIHVTN